MTKVAFVSLGCDKNLVDSEVMLALLDEEGYEIISEEENADVVIVNTCAFINDAKEESIENIIELGKLKKNNNVKSLIVTGCLAQRYQDELLKEMPEIDAIVGTTGYTNIVDVVKKTLKGEKIKEVQDINKKECENNKRLISTVGYYEYLKIAEGCDNHCTYCIIPKLRGKFRSRSIESLIIEAKKLVSKGVKELILVAQDVTSYGIDLYGEYCLPKLLKELCKIEGLRWIRLLYCYPETITDELVDTIANEEKICKYIDMPIQHANDSILKLMGRKTNQKDIRDIIIKLRNKVKDICLRTTIIVGFPGETEEKFEDLIDFVKDVKFDRLGVFAFSEEEGTAAVKLDNKVNEDVKINRQNQLMNIQESLIEEKSKEMLGKKLEVVVEGKIQDENVYMARSYKDMKDVDGLVFFESNENILTGEFIEVQIVEAKGYDLVGKLIKR